MSQVALQGHFRFDVYNKEGFLKYSKETPNFITSTGLCFPSTFAFADCFRFLSLGSGNTPNTIRTTVNNGWGTTGLSSGISTFSYIGSRRPSEDSQYMSDSCGFRENGNNVTLTRAWRVPTGDGVFDKDYTFQEFMLSPGRPFVRGLTQHACSKDDYTDQGAQGLDAAAVASYYTRPSICAADKAFTRVLKTLPVSKDDFLVVTYDLNLTFATGTQNINLNINTSQPSNPNWNGTLQGKGQLVHHGIQLISDGQQSHSNYAQRTQIPQFEYVSEYGESFIPPWGAPIEPSCTGRNIIAYLSTDNLQFLVNRIQGGGLPNPLTLPDPGYSLMEWHSQPTTMSGIPSYAVNIRRDGTSNVYPDANDYKETTSAPVGFDVSFVNASRVQRSSMTPGSVIRESRWRSGNYTAQFWVIAPNEIAFLGKPVRSMVLAYHDAETPNTVYPFFDVIFADHNGQYTEPDPYTETYTPPSDTIPSSQYFYQENGGQLTLSFGMSWSSPCDPSVCGCPGSTC